MKILVCISKTPETTAKVSFNADNTKFNEENVSFIMNPYDEWYALVRALELKEQAGGTVTIINVGDASNDSIIRKGLAIGADDAVRVNAADISGRFVAEQIANYAKENSFDLILTGKETIDFNGAVVGGMVAELLDLPFVSFATKLEINGDTHQITRDVEGGEEILEVNTPYVLSAAKGMAEQRIPNMRGIMMAKRKPLVIIEAVNSDQKEESLGFILPPVKSEVKLIDPDNMDELVKLLAEVDKVI